FAYYGGVCPAEIVPFTRFASDMAGTVPGFVWITPDLCHDGHDCSSATAEGWLARVVPMITATTAWREGGVLFITWDEGEDSSNSVLTLVIHPDPLLHVSGRAYDHYSLLASIEDLLGVGRLGHAAQAAAMTDLLASQPSPPLRNPTG
ncbi:MAG TPA: alkaline phosphatase family protein, partial [Patescibacteria group bacterium]|nr:alkaline phosphatase family protein [Patescibacteria group bacterium]